MTETSLSPGAPAAAPISIRFFAAAAEAAGTEQLHVPVPTDGIAVTELLSALPQLVREQRSSAESPASGSEGTSHDDAAAPSLERVCARSSFLINGVRARSETARLRPGDQLDVLPPFAGG